MPISYDYKEVSLRIEEYLIKKSWVGKVYGDYVLQESWGIRRKVLVINMTL